MSRLGRDYLKVGQIMEILRQKGVRLIAINDGGVTLHSFFHLPFHPLLPTDKRYDARHIRETLKYDTESQMMVNMSSTKPMLTATWLDFGAPESRFIAGYFAGAETIANDMASAAASAENSPRECPATMSGLNPS